ncbi:MAG: hypothetical protein JNL08_09850 [Planctomycetes bacterium]|nr:hypothetical protein [Planctomycetota bacterium]
MKTLHALLLPLFLLLAALAVPAQNTGFFSGSIVNPIDGASGTITIEFVHTNVLSGAVYLPNPDGTRTLFSSGGLDRIENTGGAWYHGDVGATVIPGASLHIWLPDNGTTCHFYLFLGGQMWFGILNRIQSPV